MTDVVLFDERGRRAQKLTWFPGYDTASSGWLEAQPETATILGWGFLPLATWRPTYFAARVARGWRVFELDVGVQDFVTPRVASGWWRCAAPDQRRFPNIASVEVYLRTIHARE